MVLVQFLGISVFLSVDGLQDHLILAVKVLPKTVRNKEPVDGLLVREKVGDMRQRCVVQMILELPDIQ